MERPLDAARPPPRDAMVPGIEALAVEGASLLQYEPIQLLEPRDKRLVNPLSPPHPAAIVAELPWVKVVPLVRNSIGFLVTSPVRAGCDTKGDVLPRGVALDLGDSESPRALGTEEGFQEFHQIPIRAKSPRFTVGVDFVSEDRVHSSDGPKVVAAQVYCSTREGGANDASQFRPARQLRPARKAAT